MVHFSVTSPLPPAVRLTLLAPELIWPEPGDQRTLGKLATPAFEWLAARATFVRQPPQAFENVLAGLFGLGDAPFGALRRLGEAADTLPDDGHWLCADPVHLRFHHERIVLADAGAFELDDDEAAALIAALNATFADVGQFHAATARRWYLRLNTAPQGHFLRGAVDEKFAPISTIAGRRLDGEITEQNGPLTRWLNEVQMFLHGHPVNERRQAAGQPTVNSLWLWGGGPLPELARPDFSVVCTDNPLAAGLAAASDLTVRGTAGGLDALLAAADRQARPLVVLDSLLAPVLYEDGEAWRAAWQQLEADWFAPLRSALGRRVDAVDLVAPTIYGRLGWSLHGGDRWKFWRRPRPIAALASQLADESAGQVTGKAASQAAEGAHS